MAIESINLNNRIMTPDQAGMVDLGTLLSAHQALDEYMRTDRIVFCTALEWRTLSSTAQDGVFYFVGQE